MKTSITMKQLARMLKESTDGTILSSENFELVKKSGIGRNNTPWTGLRVISKGLAKKHVVEIELEDESSGLHDFEGEPVEFKYTNAYVSYGMRMQKDTLEETRELIAVLDEAVDFAEEINEYLAEQ